MMRTATASDIPQFRRIWKDIFGDTDSFIDWFFNNCFCPDMSFCTEMDGKIVCVMHCRQIWVKLGRQPVSAVMVSGVATLPHYRRQGLMHKLFKFAADKLREMGISIFYYFPANPNFYRGLGHVNITENMVFNGVSASFPKRDLIQTAINYSHLSVMKSLYEQFMQNYSGFVIRSNSFENKLQEYLAENLLIALNSNAYIVYNKTESSIEIQEVAGEFNKISELLESFSLPINGKFPTDFPTEKLNGNINISYGNMGGIINIQRLLSETAAECPLTVQVTDSIFPENCGVFDFCGLKKQQPPDVILTSGELLQTLAGYRIHPELSEYFHKHKCFSSDLY